LLRRAAVVVKGDDPLGGSGQVGNNETVTRIKLAWIPLDRGDDAARPLLPLRPIAEAGELAAPLMRRSPDRVFQQVADPTLQDIVGREPDCVTSAFGFEELAYLGVGEGRVASEIRRFAMPR
jgi:hypothetical protein